jgi:hypothetical protein
MRAVRALLTAAATAALVAGGIATAQPAAAAPAKGACYAYTAAVLKAVSSEAPAVDCATAHTGETYYVGTVTDRFGVPSQSSQAMRLSAARPCTTAAMNAYLGMPDRKLPSRFRTAVLFPTDVQWAAGERWVRCDVVLQGGLALKPITGTAAALVASTPQTQFDFCTPGQPNAKATSAYPCTTPKKNWIKVLDAELGGPGSKFPGQSTVERKTRNLCEKQGKKWSAKQKYPGWWAIWPTAVGWRQGHRSAQCFVPYQQYAKQLEINSKKNQAPAPAPAPTTDPQPAPAT